jgi:methionyl-tRNA synthetase
MKQKYFNIVTGKEYTREFKSKQCAECGHEFEPVGGAQKYCQNCTKAVERKRYRKWYARHYKTNKAA